MLRRRALISLTKNPISQFSTSTLKPTSNLISTSTSQTQKRSLRHLFSISSSPTTLTNNGVSSVRNFSMRSRGGLDESSYSNRPPNETILLEGCDFRHWLIVVEKPDPSLTRDDIIDSYIRTLAQVVGSEDEARRQIYSVSTRHYFAFGCIIEEEISYKLKELPHVRWVLPDSYLKVKEKDYGGEPFIDGQAVPYDPKYHEEWVQNNDKANNRRDRKPRNQGPRDRPYRDNRPLPSSNHGVQGQDGNLNVQNQRMNPPVPYAETPRSGQNQGFTGQNMPPQAPLQGQNFQNRNVQSLQAQNQGFQNGYVPMQNQQYQNGNMPPMRNTPNVYNRSAPPVQNNGFSNNGMAPPPQVQNQNFQNRGVSPQMPNQGFQNECVPQSPQNGYSQSRDMPPQSPPMNQGYHQHGNVPPPAMNQGYQHGNVPAPTQNWSNQGAPVSTSTQNRSTYTAPQQKNWSYPIKDVPQPNQHGSDSTSNLNQGSMPVRDQVTR